MSENKKTIAIVGGGPSGLMAAEILSRMAYSVTVYEAMPTVARKFLLAGKSGLNITHSEAFGDFAGRFGAGSPFLRSALEGFSPGDVRAWTQALGTETFVGTSGRVFPTAMKASPLLRAWLKRLEGQGVSVLTRHRWLGFGADGSLSFETPEGVKTVEADSILLALGGASWPRLGSDAAWVPVLAADGVDIAPLRAANCGFDVEWSDFFRERFAGHPVKSVTATSEAGVVPGEFVITRTGIEGSLVYAHAAALRDRLESGAETILEIDLMPGRSFERLVADLRKQGSKSSFSTRLRKAAGIDGVKAGLLREAGAEGEPEHLAGRIKALPIRVVRPRPIAEAISVAGGVRFDAIDDNFMLKARRGVFVAGEMLDWEAPTGGYLLTACLAMGKAVAQGIDRFLSSKSGEA